MKPKKIIIAVGLIQEAEKPFQFLKEMPIHPDSEIQLIHMITENLYVDDLEFALSTPTENEKKLIVEQVTKKLQKFKDEFLPGLKNVSLKVLFDTNIRAAFTDHVKNQKADLVVVATRSRHGIKGLFDSSFAQHQVKYSPANVLVLR